jgi:hypothetical protein
MSIVAVAPIATMAAMTASTVIIMSSSSIRLLCPQEAMWQVGHPVPPGWVSVGPSWRAVLAVEGSNAIRAPEHEWAICVLRAPVARLVGTRGGAVSQHHSAHRRGCGCQSRHIFRRALCGSSCVTREADLAVSRAACCQAQGYSAAGTFVVSRCRV